MFEISDLLCSRYSSLNPFMIRREKSGEVFLLINRVMKQRKESEDLKTPLKKGDQVLYDVKGNKIIRRPATDDSWY